MVLERKIPVSELLFVIQEGFALPTGCVVVSIRISKVPERKVPVSDLLSVIQESFALPTGCV